MTMLSFKQVESMVRKSTANKVVVGLLSFLIVWILDIYRKYGIITKEKKCVK